jgi:hypothetical protein
MKIQKELLGPEKPIYTPKLYPCQRCGIMNINRFKCRSCWDDFERGGGVDDAMAANNRLPRKGWI